MASPAEGPKNRKVFFSPESDEIFQKHASGKVSEWYAKTAKRLGSPTGMLKDVRNTGNKFSDADLRIASWLKHRSHKSSDSARLKARNLFMKLDKSLSAKDASQEWKRLCELGKNPSPAVAALGHDPFVYEGESLLDSGACEHICGIGLLTGSQKAMIFKNDSEMSFATAGG